jgi:hypothetical protein
VKTIIDKLEKAKSILEDLLIGDEDDPTNVVWNIVKEVINEIKTPLWIPYKDLSYAHDLLQAAENEVEEIPCSDKRKILQATTKISCAMGALETLIPLPLLHWETPEKRKDRTGEEWPDDWAVYYRVSKADCWVVFTYGEAKRDAVHSFIPLAQIICATEAGRPPDGWEPFVEEEEKTNGR